MSMSKKKLEAIALGNQIARKTIERIARQEGLCYDTIYHEIQSSIINAMRTLSKESYIHFKRMRKATGHETPTPEDFIIYCSALSNSHNLPNDFATILNF
ncbi:MAG: hypothetical protein ACRC3H_22055 [Lachnospiraceae bacterium]